MSSRPRGQYYDGDVNLPVFLTAKNFKPLIPNELYVTSSQIEFRCKGSGKAFGYDRFLTKRINHEECYSDGEACTNQAESFFSRLRRVEIGTHHHISGRYLYAYAGEMAWRENNRRVSIGTKYLGAAAAALNAPVLRQSKGRWQFSLALT